MANPPWTSKSRAELCIFYINKYSEYLQDNPILTLEGIQAPPQELYTQSNNYLRYSKMPEKGRNIINNILEIKKEIREINHLDDDLTETMDTSELNLLAALEIAEEKTRYAFQH